MIELDLKGVSGVGGVVLNPGKYCSTAYLFCAEPGGGGGGGGGGDLWIYMEHVVPCTSCSISSLI